MSGCIYSCPDWLRPSSSVDNVDGPEMPHPSEAFSMLCSPAKQNASAYYFLPKEDLIGLVEMPAETDPTKLADKSHPVMGNSMEHVQGAGMKEPNMPKGTLTGSAVNYYLGNPTKSSQTEELKQEEASETLLNYYKEKCVKLDCELAQLRRKWDVLSEKYEYFSEIVASSKQVVSDYKKQLEILANQNKELEKEAAGWKRTCLRMQHSPDEIPSTTPKRCGGSTVYYQDTNQAGAVADRKKKSLLIQDPSEVTETARFTYETVKPTVGSPKVFTKVIKGTHWYYEHDIREPEEDGFKRRFGSREVRYSE